METLNLNLIPTGANPVAHVSQYDEGRVIRFNLFEGSAVYTLDGTETIECDVKKPDGNVVTLAVTNTSSTYVEVTTTLQMCACSGESLGDIKITKGAVVIATLNFILSVERSPLENGIESDSEIHNLEQQIADAVADQYDADSVIFDSVPTAGHGIGYAVTSEGVLNSIPEELDDLSDVTTTAPTSGEALVWDGSKWTNGTVSTVGSIDDLNDVDTTGKANADSLRYNATAQEWEAKPTTVEMTLAEYEALGGDYSGYENTNIIITDAPNLNATAQDISYDGSTDTVWDKVEEISTIVNGTIASGDIGASISFSRYKLWKCNGVAHINANIAVSATIAGTSKICDLPSGFGAGTGVVYDFTTIDTLGNTIRGYLNGDRISFNFVGNVQSGAGVIFQITWKVA